MRKDRKHKRNRPEDCRRESCAGCPDKFDIRLQDPRRNQVAIAFSKYHSESDKLLIYTPRVTGYSSLFYVPIPRRPTATNYRVDKSGAKSRSTVFDPELLRQLENERNRVHKFESRDTEFTTNTGTFFQRGDRCWEEKQLLPGDIDSASKSNARLEVDQEKISIGSPRNTESLKPADHSRFQCDTR